MKLNKKYLTLAFVIVVVLAIAGGIFYYQFNSKKEESESFTVSYKELKAEEVDDLSKIESQEKIVYAQREVIDNKGNENVYQTRYYVTNSKGEKKYNFYTADDLTFEIGYPYLEDKILILTEFGQADNRVVNLKGEVLKEVFIPGIDFGTDFVVSDDHKKVAYLENQSKANLENELSFDFNYLIKVKDLESGVVEEFNPEEIKHEEIEYSQFVPGAFSQDGKKLYIFASQYGLDLSYQNPNGLYEINLENNQIKEIYYSSIENQEEKDLLVLLGVFPRQNLALVNRGPRLSKDDETVFRTQIQKINLETGEFKDLYIDEYTDRVGSGGKILSPDGHKLILLNNAYYDRGLSLYNLETKKMTKLLDQGEFVTWMSDNQTIIYRLYKTKENEPGQIDQTVEIHSLNIDTGGDYKLYSQESVNEGTGMNEMGDKFYTFIGLI
ncbi:MAG: hypothetical protein U5L76_00360 [Patescibacteria group bacterium]|nr:hypothetical protein [Patescibacteria group bacterium]